MSSHGPKPGTTGSEAPLLRQNVAVLFSEATRRAYVNEALARGETYAFTGADGEQQRWLKGEYAYLAPNAARTLLHRFNVKHDLIGEEEIAGDALAAYRLLLVPNAGYLTSDASSAIAAWITEPGADHRRLLVTGRTNLPPALLGLVAAVPCRPEGYTAWRFLPESPFADRTIWEERYLTSYRGYTAMRAEAAPVGRVLADLWELAGPNPADPPRQRIGDAVVVTDRTLYIANQVLEYLGGVIQAHLNIDDVRDWPFPTHYLDTVGYLLRELMRLIGLEDLFTTQLRSFGTYTGLVVLRHDADVPPEEEPDLAMLHWQQANQVPATYVVLDPAVSPEHTTAATSQTWVAEAGRTNLLEVGLHNDGYAGSPPTYVSGRALADHILAGDQRLGITSATIGRHFGFHFHPETLDAMAYAYDQAPELIGMCTFSVLQVIEYGVQDPAVSWLGQPITYSTRYRADGWTSGAVTGWWFPHHVVIATVDGQRTLRGWDSTKESECDYGRIDELLAGDNTRQADRSTRLPNSVITIQYHPQSAHSSHVNHGQGSLPWVQYLCLAAERHGFGLATKRAVYERLNDYETVLFRAEADGTIVVANPSERAISGLMVSLPGPVGAVLGNGYACIHVVAGTTFTLPELAPRQTLRLEPTSEGRDLPVITQPNSKRLEILSAVNRLGSGETEVTVRAAGQSNLLIGNPPASRAEVIIYGLGDGWPHQLQAEDDTLVIPIHAPADATVTLRITVRYVR
jgi:hypothetical protein